MTEYMSMTDDAAALLAGLRRSGRQIADLPPALRPASLAAGYDIQDHLVAALGETIRGWKLGVGSIKAKRETGFGRSVAGRVLGSRTFENGATVPLLGAAPVVVEFEIAFVLGRDIHPAEDPAAVMDSVSETRVTFELVRTSFIERSAVGFPSFAADNSGFEALIIGGTLDPADITAATESVVVSVDGVERARMATGDDATDPVAAMTGFAGLAQERGMILPQGSIISTGTATLPFPLAAPATITAHYLGAALSCRIVLA
jgi:2-keto-4-pentenoate hydratase